MELLILGIDALDPRILMDNIDKFPNMKRLISEGVFSDYFGYADGYGSNDNWISLYTGLEPERHGVVNNRCIKTMEKPSSLNYYDKNPFWDILNANDVSTGLWRLTSLNPIKKIRGYMVGGLMNFEFQDMFTKEETLGELNIIEKDILSLIDSNIRPIELIRRLTSIEDMDIEKEIKNLLSKDNYYEEALDYLNWEVEYFKRNIIKVQKKIPVDLLFYYNTTLDLIQHTHQYDPLKRITIDAMISIDRFIGELIYELDPKNIIIISDHGISSFTEVLGKGNRELEEEAFGMAKDAIWLDNGEIVVKARNGGILSAIHDIKGTFIASGEKFKENHHIKDMRNIDFYPTLLEFFDIKVPYGRNGYVLDVFKDKKIVNKDMIYPKDHKVKDILLVQNIEVYNFNKSLNQLFLNNRFSYITILCEKKYEKIFSLNPRIDNIITYEDKINIEDYINNYDEIYIPSIRTKDKKINYLRVK